MPCQTYFGGSAECGSHAGVSSAALRLLQSMCFRLVVWRLEEETCLFLVMHLFFCFSSCWLLALLYFFFFSCCTHMKSFFCWFCDALRGCTDFHYNVYGASSVMRCAAPPPRENCSAHDHCAEGSSTRQNRNGLPPSTGQGVRVLCVCMYILYIHIYKYI